MDTWGSLHAGDVVLSSDDKRELWGAAAVAGRRVTLVRHGQSVTGYPEPAEPVSVVSRCDTSAEAMAWQVLDAAGLQPQVISETWESET
jgi:fructose-1,6-bisphosphatase/inositol monophosphatase family enzyme